MQNMRLVCILIAVPVLLLIPYFAMKFGDEVNWTTIDFIVMGFMLLVTGLAIEVALRIVKVSWMKTAAVLVILFGFVMVWGALVRMGG